MKKLFIPFIKILSLLAIVIFALWIGQVARESDAIKNIVYNFGYFGIFTISVISGFNIVVPIPAISFLPLFLESGLSMTTTIIIISIGMTLADMLAHIIGKTGRQLTDFANTKTFLYLEGLQKKKPWIPVLILFLYASFIPMPNELLLIPMGFLGYRIGSVIFPILAGNLIFNIIYASAILSIFTYL